MTTPIMSASEIPQYPSIGALKRHLTINSCKICSLGFQENLNGCCVARGSESSNKMIIGEAPGKEEDSRGLPFTGPAGKLMDDIWQSVGMDTNDWYVTNVVLCRPIAPKGSGKENYTPKLEQIKRCRPYLDKQIQLIKPKIIVTIGAIATAAIVGQKSVIMGNYRGQLLSTGMPAPFVFPMIHPAAILHSKGNQTQYDLYRQLTYNDIQTLKGILEKENI